MNLHIGSEIKRVLNEKGITPEWLAKKITTSRRNLYDILTREEIGTKQLMQISKALNYDFFSLFQDESEIAAMVNDPLSYYENLPKPKPTVLVSVSLDGEETTLRFWFDKLTKINAAMA